MCVQDGESNDKVHSFVRIQFHHNAQYDARAANPSAAFIKELAFRSVNSTAAQKFVQVPLLSNSLFLFSTIAVSATFAPLGKMRCCWDLSFTLLEFVLAHPTHTLALASGVLSQRRVTDTIRYFRQRSHLRSSTG